ncbi:helix-hairpin-helix domain-containing protein [uncultured Tenacibaculum sp.]|uniref:ComEA family DNA-binding protein n=1 Tax=uncultured Tenacibaculum sp. TaxID=174713 RepID=UPI002617C8E5|nr:helix-hairpin-helix domain-containing protein [uncultured Tenacibaculum sp.]
MKNIKSHFWYNKRQRNGIFFLIILIVVLQSIYLFVDFSSSNIINDDTEELLVFKNKIDSLKRVAIEKRKFKLYPFNPNYITDYKGYQLGMSIEEIGRLHAYRGLNRYVNSKKEFQKVTEVSDSLLNKIAPYFKFPDWVINRNKRGKEKKALFVNRSKIESNIIENKVKLVSTNDINKATKKDFETVNGVGEIIAERILKYRKKIQGYTYKEQLNEVWGLDKEIINDILSKFKIDRKPTIEKINVNTATFKEVLKNPYIDYDLCKKIFEYRDEVAELQDISELKNIDGFPVEKYERIVLYLEAK